MKRLVLCLDGTWNTPDQTDRGLVRPTNVVKLARAVLPSDPATGMAQTVYYDKGVGTGDFVDRFLGGAFGRGLGKNIEDAYRFLAMHFEPGDRIWCFGFSRGAYTARSLVGMIRNCGIVRKDHAARIEEAFALYRDRDKESKRPDGAESRAFRAAYAHETEAAPGDRFGETATRVAFLGVWDTVGALGIPLSPLRWITMRRHQFHDVRLSRIVDRACHALAIDEKRTPFVPTLWDTAVTGAGHPVEQVWFAGVHSNVGGGYADCGLSDVTLEWMMERAQAAGLAFDPAFRTRELACDGCGEIRDSMTIPYRMLGEHVRPIGALEGAREDVHAEALRRHREPALAYRPHNLLAYLARAAGPA